ncbi:fatty-acid--CoA ligase [Cupriavidus sp. USMAA2-4]|uniref:class I adenylate-forming enzyme family protein n=1 Tax=Cupriavidus sp. USMAA2-4 TaxID=876364 RepID=UPI0008A6D6D9|nr:AMP-binding protein [Cupriavidus sp. USMAA2-4]AOY96279.1 fatty-acid--CoA ligase [Cupriavidus sp. USMAA2-4]
MNLVAMLEATVRNQPHRPALRYEGATLSYQDFNAMTRRAATVLQGRGVTRGSRVALMCTNTPGFLVAMFGALRLGAAVVPVNHKLQAAEVDYILAHSGARHCIHDGRFAAVLAGVSAPLQCLTTATAAAGSDDFDALVAAAPEHAGIEPDAGDLAEILYTSGTTGKPKGCLHTHASVFAAALGTAAGMSITREERMLVAMPIWHASPLNNWTLSTLLMGGTVVLLREYEPAAFLRTIQQERTTCTFCAPVALLAPLHAVPDFAAYDLGSMRLWTCGGGPLGAGMARRLADAYRSPHFVQVYGMTETGPLGTALYADEAIARAGSIGRASMPGVQMRVIKDDGSPAGPGEVGEIRLRSDAMMQGYLDDPEASANAFDSDGWYASGDLAQVDEDGYLTIVDRAKDMVITGGENVYSKEVEDVLSTHPLVQDVAMIGRPHPEWGETVTACVVLKPGAAPGAADVEALRTFLAPRLARYKIPRRVELYDTLPRTPTGKLMKHVLRGRAA